MHQFFPQFSAGTEVLTYSVARELMRRGHEVSVFTGHPSSPELADDERFDEYEFDGIHVYRFHHAYAAMGGQSSVIEIGYDNHLAAKHFADILTTYKPDVVHFFHLNRLGTGLIECTNQRGVPAFLTPTDFWAVCQTGQLLLGEQDLCSGPSARAGNCLKHLAQLQPQGVIGLCARLLPTRLVDQLVTLTVKGILPVYPKCTEVVALSNRLSVNISRLNRLNKIIAPNNFMRDFLIQHGIKSELISVAPFGIDVTKSESVKLRVQHLGPLRVAFIGTLAPHKGCHILLDAFKKLPAGCAVLMIYGQMDDFPSYVHKLKHLATGQHQIEFCGTFLNSEIAHVFEDIDVLVVPSTWYENSPLVVYSAQAARCPVVASNLPGLIEAVHADENGLLFEVGNACDLARQLLRLITEDGLLQNLSNRSIRPKSVQRYVDELLDVWQTSTPASYLVRG